MDYSFTRYLAAKQTVDDRALNGHVWQVLWDTAPPGPRAILEIGAGTGTMIDRLSARGRLAAGDQYTAIDTDVANVAAGQRRLTIPPCALEWEAIDVHRFAERERGRRAWDLLIAHAFLDLVNVPRLLPVLLALLRPGGLFYFTLNFDGLTVLEPPLDPPFDAQVIDLYHRTMDERLCDGRPTAGSRSGRTLLSQLPAAGAEILAAGASDWVVLPSSGGYPTDEAYFLHHILHFFETSLTGRPELDPARLAGWLARRRAQIEAGELVFMAHQVDVCVRVGE